MNQKTFNQCFNSLYNQILESIHAIKISESTLEEIQAQNHQLINSLNHIGKMLKNTMAPQEICRKLKYALASFYDRLLFDLLSKDKAELSNVNYENISLETQIFHTSVAGEELFKQIKETMLYENDDYKKSMLLGYLKILIYGFNEHNSRENLELLKLDLFQVIFHTKPFGNVVFDLHTLPQDFVSQHGFSFKSLLSILILTYLGATSVIWLFQVQSINLQIDNISNIVEAQKNV